ncbi:TRAFAC clade GTPase domain-containing protein [Nocardia bovistercoris]|uniref:Double-GTPase 2 domain-containing protein n=1 Tax=Nocardia bovistercoris TaxID=2785916 RepID=A0A931IFW4_9NOCA|nr:hypothetical protein [Nocardia bovistercoris]MBH0779610.1 hypothetical protein [Nocardia bovistercoris]
MTKCPLCFHTLTPDRISWMSTSGEATADRIATRYAGFPVSSRTIVEAHSKKRGAPVPSRDAAMTMVGSEVQEVCPDCHHPLPERWRDHDTVCIAMAGARATGKTIYIAVLVRALQMAGERLGRVVEPHDQRTAESYEQFYETILYKERRMLSGTISLAGRTAADTDHGTLVLRLGHSGGRQQLLVIRDVAGEDLQNRANASEQWTRFFGHADGVVFMFDPLKVPSVENQLRGLIPQAAPDTSPPLTVLQTVLSMIGSNNPRLAVVLSKFDALHELRNVRGSEWSTVMSNPGAGFSRDPSANRTGYDENDGELVDAEVRSLLTMLRAKPIIDAVDSPHTGARLNSRFFAVSALGALPAGQRVYEGGISPFRCLDPVRWILDGAGVWN